MFSKVEGNTVHPVFGYQEYLDIAQMSLYSLSKLPDRIQSRYLIRFRPFKVIFRFQFQQPLFLFIGLEALISTLLIVMQGVLPDLMQEYAEMIEKSGLADMTVLSTIGYWHSCISSTTRITRTTLAFLW